MTQHRVAFLISKLDVNGTAKCVFDLATYMGQQGVDVHVIAKTNDNVLGEATHFTFHALSDDGKLSRFRALNQRAFRNALKHLLNQLESKQLFDVVFSSGIHMHRMIQPLKRPNVRYWIHRNITQEYVLIKPKYRRRREKLYTKSLYGQHLMCVSQGVADDVQRNTKIQPKVLEVKYNLFDLEGVRQQAAQSANLPSLPYMIHIGRYSPEKRHDLLLAAYQQLDNPPLLVLLTEASPALQTIIDGFGLAERVIVAGLQQNPYPWMAQAKLLVLCSDQEGLPRVLVESLVCGTPVVSTDCPSGPSEILQGDLAKWLVPTDDAKALASKMQQALDAPETINQIDLTRFDMKVNWQQYLSM